MPLKAAPIPGARVGHATDRRLMVVLLLSGEVLEKGSVSREWVSPRAHVKQTLYSMAPSELALAARCL